MSLVAESFGGYVERRRAESSLTQRRQRWVFLTCLLAVYLWPFYLLGVAVFPAPLTGLGIAKLLVTVGGDPTGGFLPAFFIPNEMLVTGAALVVLLGVVAGLLPAIQTLRQDNLEAIRKVI